MKIITLDLFPKRRPRWCTKERYKFLIENKEVCTAILADTLGLHERTVLTYMQRLGLRPMAGHK